MFIKIEKFRNMPFSAKVGVTLWVAGWIWFISICHYLLRDANVTIKFSIAMCILGLFLSQAQNWARWISVLANTLGIFYSSHFFIIGKVFISVVNVILFAGAIYFLIASTTSNYFKSQNRPTPSQDKNNR